MFALYMSGILLQLKSGHGKFNEWWLRMEVVMKKLGCKYYGKNSQLKLLHLS